MSDRQRSEPMSWGEIVGFALLAGVVGLLFFSGRSSNPELVLKGTRMPPLMAEGWLNTDESPSFGGVAAEKLKSQVVVVDCWATWCPPCRAAMPELAELYAKYKPLGVEFLGLTSETSRDLPAIEKFVRNVEGFDWPVGYGTLPMQDQLGISLLPTVIVFGADGRAVWSGNQLDGIESALDQALATGSPEQKAATVARE